MKRIKNFSLVFLITSFLFLILDFLIGERFLKKIGLIYLEELIRVSNDQYEYSFEKNLNVDYAVWGNQYYKLCTDNRGFKFNCFDEEKKTYEIAIIGDSFTEGIGLPFEKTFVGMLKSKKNLDLVNLGVASYSPHIYLKKIKYLISNKIIKFNHIIVAVDLSDLEDDWIRSSKLKKNINEKKNLRFELKEKIKKKLIYNLPITYIILKKINWFVKINLKNQLNANHLEYKNNRASWSYDLNYKNLNEKLKIHIKKMTETYNYLKDNNIKFSILIYPHQVSIKYDKKNSLYRKTWEEFCINKCINFIDAYTVFFDELNHSSKEEIMKKYYIPGDPHFNEEGNKKIYEILNLYL